MASTQEPVSQGSTAQDRIADTASDDDKEIDEEDANSESSQNVEDEDMNGEDCSVKTMKRKNHICDQCKKVFCSKRELLLHQYNHKEKLSYYCAFCFKSFPSEYAFKRHNKIHEKRGKKRDIKCIICYKEFDYVKDLEEHHRKEHLNQKLFRCMSCKAEFSWKENLKKHMRMHTTGTVTVPKNNDNSRKCSKCDKGFMDNISLRLHECGKKKVEEKPDKPYVCKICHKAFKFDFSFEAHMNSHEGPVAITAWKKMQQNQIVQRKKVVEAEAEKQLQASKPEDEAAAQDNSTTNQAGGNEVNSAIITAAQEEKKDENLKEIVLEIVNVNELPKGESRGGEILAEGDDNCPSLPVAVTAIEEADRKPENEPPAEEPEEIKQPQNEEETTKTEESDEENTDTDVKDPETPAEGKKKEKSQPRSKRPLLYDYVMTEEKPFQCPKCQKEFRWEISLNIHLQEHIRGPLPAKQTRSRKQKDAGNTPLNPAASRIVTQRVSSDEEDNFDEDFHYQQSAKRKRGRPRKYPIDVAPPVKRKRGRPCKMKKSTGLGSGNETVVIRVTKGAKSDEYEIRQEGSRTKSRTDSTSALHLEENIVNIPRHRLIRFYLLRQLKLSRIRGFFPCRFCNKPFSCKASLNMHILRHTGKGAYMCNHCGQKFPDHRTLVLHRLIEEEEDVPPNMYQCSTCCRLCSSKKRLIKHLFRHLVTVWPTSQPRASRN